MSGRYDYVDSWETMSGGRMLGHRIAFMPSRGNGGYGAVLPTGDTSRYFKITTDGTVFFKQRLAGVTTYLIAFDGPSREKIISGDPGGYVNFAWDTSKRDVTTEARKRELDDATVESRGTYADAEKRAREIIAAGEAALTEAGKAIVAPKVQAGSGSELLAYYDERDRAGAAAAAAAAEAAKKKKPKRKRKPAKKGIPTWAWIAGGGVLLLLVVGGFALRKRGTAQIGA